jgi:ASC-1-like (ASCH) protein
MILTKHGKKRIKERLGLPKRAHIKHINKVLKKGVVYAKRGYEELKIIYNGFLYIFAFS